MRSLLPITGNICWMLENEKQAEGIYEMDYETQYDYFAQYLKWLKAGKHTVNLEKGPQNKTCNAYLKEVILKIQKEAYGYACLTNYKSQNNQDTKVNTYLFS